MATITEIREMLRNGEVVTMPSKYIPVFMQQCSDHPCGDECYEIKPGPRGYSIVIDPRKVKMEGKA